MSHFFRNVIGKKYIFSWEQLQKDFGEFPPTPLRSTQRPKSKFTINYMNRIGMFLFKTRNAFNLIRYLINPPDDKFVLECLEDFKKIDVIDDLIGVKKQLLDLWNYSNFFTRVLFIVVLVIFSPVLAFLLLFLCSRTLLSIARETGDFDNKAGFFHPFPSCRQTIHINSNRSADSI